MNLKVKKVIMSIAIIGVIFSAGAVAANANSITLKGHQEAWAGGQFNDTYAWTGSTGGYVYAQSYQISTYNGQGRECTGAVGYNSWAQTPRVSYSPRDYYIQGRHWSDTEYIVS